MVVDHHNTDPLSHQRVLHLKNPRFGSLVIQALVKKPGDNRWYASCLCDCGSQLEAILFRSIKHGPVKSCGCVEYGLWGKSYSPESPPYNMERRVWRGMIRRCYEPTDSTYKRYGGRQENPVTVCDRWRESFEAFLHDMGPRPGPRYSLDRINNAEGYTPDNTRWNTREGQARNTTRAIFLTLNGIIHTLIEWSEITKLDYQTLFSRKELGWSDEKTLTTPLDDTKGKLRLITAFNTVQTLSQWAREFHIPLSTLKNRLNRGMVPEEALTTAIDHRKGKRRIS